MKTVEINMRPTDIKGIKFNNSFMAKPGEPVKMEVKTNVGIKLNPAAPTIASVVVLFSARDEKETILLEVETVTMVSVNTFVDNLDKVIKDNYINTIMMAVNEKIRVLATMVGLNITVPAVKFEYSDESDSIDADIFRNM
ncbi:MAG: hypothetical protein IJZ00_06885 [Lachnospiraceae bacterium]|nr:hypothetical protein [Lachnospiraceae bacterium]MBQ8261992.1 hypothetical protein [Lachnospiraceae bacterium]